MPRVRHQLALQLPPELLAQIRDVAARQDRTVTAVVRGWIEVGLTGAAAPPVAGVEPERIDALARRVEALEAALAALQGEPAMLPAGPPPRGEQAPPVLTSPERGNVHPPAEGPAGAITTGELANLLDMRPATLAERVRRRGGGIGFEANGWRIVGSSKPASGGPPRWLWQPIDAA